MRKSSYLILILNIISIIVGMYLLRHNSELITNYAIDSSDHIPLSKGNLILIGLVPFVVVFTMDILATIEDQEVKPFIKVYDHLKYMICFSFQVLYGLIVLSQLYVFNEKYIVGSIIAVVVFYIAYILPKIPRNQVIGFKNKWTLSSDDIWNKVHKRGRIIGYFITLIIVGLTFSKHLAIAGIAISAVVIGLIYLYYYSYRLAQK